MTYRFLTKVAAAIAGQSLTHGLLTTPDEYFLAPEDAAAATAVFFSTVPVDATHVHITASVTGTVTVVARNALAIMK